MELELLIGSEEIEEKVKEIAEKIGNEYEGKKTASRRCPEGFDCVSFGSLEDSIILNHLDITSNLPKFARPIKALIGCRLVKRGLQKNIGLCLGL